MIHEAIEYQDDTTYNTQSSQPSPKKNTFRNILKVKFANFRRRNVKSKCHLEKYTFNLDENQKATESSTSVSSSSETVVFESHPVPSIKSESSTNSWSKSTLLGHFPWNNTLKRKSSSTSEASTNSDIQETFVDSTKKKKIFGFPKRNSIPFKKWNSKNNFSDSTINSCIECSNDEQNDSAYETEPDSPKKDVKKKKIRRTKMKTLSSRDSEYIEIQSFFKAGLPNKNILGIIRLQMPTKLVEAHEKFKNEMAQKNPGIQTCHRMFHGTKTAFICKPRRFTKNKCAIFCKIGCGVCGIAQEGNRTKYSHYSQRMWFANNSATSLSYCGSYNVKAMFVVDVVSASPNSILIIEKDEATIPKYLIIFK